MSSPLAGRIVVVTGAARGLGAGLAEGLARRGARVALVDLEPAELAAVSARCPGSAWFEVDVTDGAGLARVAASVAEQLGPASVVVANAGIAAGGSLLVADAAAYDRVIEVNLLGSIRTVRAFLPQVVQTQGYVLQVASLAALVPMPLMSAYCASKSGVEAFALSVRGEVAPFGAAVGVGYLSWTDTDMVRGADAVPGLRDLRAGIPGVLGRTYPLGPVVSRFVAGIEARSPRVYGQRWLSTLALLRGCLPWALAHAPAAKRRDLEKAMHQVSTSGTMPVGAGGAADTAAREGAHD
ncbi:MAG: SDR family oxidoreductase [Actinomycetota bacterium]|nr:SDR family oxidoreductase [Actinomycetota bacterium]